jgi:hypothetical protein
MSHLFGCSRLFAVVRRQVGKRLFGCPPPFRGDNQPTEAMDSQKRGCFAVGERTTEIMVGVL